MFLLMGVSSKIKECGMAPRGACPVCNSRGTLHVCNKYMTPHVFFIPTFRLGSTYIATCTACASVMQLAKDKGRAVERGVEAEILPDDLEILQNNAAPCCPRCGNRLGREDLFCSRCGERL